MLFVCCNFVLQTKNMIQLPKDFIDRTQPLLGEEWDAFVQALGEASPTSIRVNRRKTAKDLPLEKVLWCNDGYYLADRPQFTFDPLLHAGLFYVQEASSMFVDFALKKLVKGDVRCLDLCAAPGGKSTIIANHIGEDSLLVSNEIVRSRAHILSENLMKWGTPNIVVSNNKPEDFLAVEHYFDLMLVDAPCSGEGMFRKDPQAINEWSVDNVRLCAERQKDILKSVWGALKSEGYLLYSTCTYNKDENEDVVAWICDTFDAEVISLPIEEAWGITKSEVNGGETYHFYPHKTKGEGFFLAVIQKKGHILEKPSKSKKNKRVKESKSNLFEDKLSFLNSENLYLIEEKGVIYAFPKTLQEDFYFLSKELSLIHKGVNLGEMKGRDFIPHQSLSLSSILNKSKFDNLEVDWSTAISYLKKEALVLQDAPKGILLLSYRNSPIGFVKNLGSRANNLYPNEWRIRSANIPDEIVSILGV